MREDSQRRAYGGRRARRRVRSRSRRSVGCARRAARLRRGLSAAAPSRDALPVSGRCWRVRLSRPSRAAEGRSPMTPPQPALGARCERCAMEVRMNQPRLRRCPRCGELKGEAVIADPYGGIVRLPVICICRGISCPQCGKRLIRRPISNHYHESTDTVWHTAWFCYLRPCPTCRRSAAQQAPRRADTSTGNATRCPTTPAGGSSTNRLRANMRRPCDE